MDHLSRGKPLLYLHHYQRIICLLKKTLLYLHHCWQIISLEKPLLYFHYYWWIIRLLENLFCTSITTNGSSISWKTSSVLPSLPTDHVSWKSFSVFPIPLLKISFVLHHTGRSSFWQITNLSENLFIFPPLEVDHVPLGKSRASEVHC